MKTAFKSLLVTTMLVGLMALYATPAKADSNTADQNAILKCTATSGDYGQSTNNCTLNNTQSVQQGNRVLGIRKLSNPVVNTAADPTATAAATGVLASTIAGAVVTFKKMRG